MRHRTLTTIDVDGIEVELNSNPEYFEPETLKPTPDTLVVGYLIHDEDCFNPMTDNDCEGTLYTFNEGVISDDKYAPHKLGLNSFLGGYARQQGYNLDYNLELDGISERVADMVRAKIKADPEMVTWMTASVLDKDATMEALVEDLVAGLEYGGWYSGLDWSSETDQDMISRLGDYETLATIAWEDMYAEGKIGEYLAIPVRYVDNNHGPGTTTIDTASLDDCNAVWVPDACAIENMSFNGCETYADKLVVAEKYAHSVLKNYEMWCNGDCWGDVVESFKLEDGQYVRLDEDSCWGFIGQEYAEEALRDRMQEVADEMKEESE